MLERTHTRWQSVTRAFEQRWILRRARRPGPPRFLVAHNLLLGDTIMLTPLLAKLRANHPQAEIVLLAAPASVPLYSGRPYGVRALPFKPAHWASTDALWGEGPFDLAVVAGDNRYSWLAAAMGARHIVAHAGDHPWTKDWFVDEQRPYPDHPAAWGDMAAGLVDGREPAPFRREDWPAPQAEAFEPPAGRYAVLHVGASTPLKQWPAERWRELAESLAARGVEPVWSAGRGQEPLVAACDARGRWRSFAGRLDLPQLWHLLRGAALLVAPDTGVAHLGRASWTPTVALFGPGSDVICGPGEFWRDTPWRSVTVADFPCRDQPILFRREVAWVKRCQRSLTECAEPRCMHAIGLPAVLAAVDDFLAARRAEAT